MTKKKQKKVYVPPVMEELNMDYEVQLLQSSIWDGKYNTSHTTTSSTEEGISVTREDEYGVGSSW